MDRKAIKQGYTFERYAAKILDGRLQPGSGNKFYAKNDCVGHGLSVSCKSKAFFAWSQIKRYLRQSIDDSYGTGNIPVLALEDKSDNIQLIVMRLTDFAEALNGDVTTVPEYVESKGISKRKEAKTPLMLRDNSGI
jgi:hypothetical protein